MRLDFRTIKRGHTTRTGAVVFLVVRDEDYFLPYFFEHYRRIGFEEFLVYADRCSPPTLDLLVTQSDTTVLTGDYTFGQTFGTLATGCPRRLSQLLKESSVDLLPDRWVLVADADEFLILPPPIRTISELIKVLSHQNQPYATAPMVDMYPQYLAMRNYPHTVAPFDVSIFFDAGPYYTWNPEKVAPDVHHAGVRQRLMKLLAQRYPSDLFAIYGERSIAASLIYKVPLLRHGVGIRRSGDHAITVGTSAANGVALAHFKFTPCLDRKIAVAVEEGQYYRGSVEYKWLGLAMAKLPFEPLVGPETRQFTGPESFVAADLISSLD
jgi:hypothetical protein